MPTGLGAGGGMPHTRAEGRHAHGATGMCVGACARGCPPMRGCMCWEALTCKTQTP